jgi:hypothetical protein
MVGMGFLLAHRLNGSAFLEDAIRRGWSGLTEKTAQQMYIAIGLVLIGFALVGALVR